VRKLDGYLGHIAGTKQAGTSSEIEINIHQASDLAIFALLATRPQLGVTRRPSRRREVQLKKAVLILVLAIVAGGAAQAGGALRDGDIIFHTSRSAQSAAIQRATHSPYSHMGVILYRDGKPFVFEAIATVRYTPLESWTARGDGGRFVVRRLTRALKPADIKKLHASAKLYEGKPYDLYFEWTNTSIYCSELVWKMYHEALGIEVGKLQELREFDLTDPAVKAKMRERYGAKIPLGERVISPAAMFDSGLLETVPTGNIGGT